MRRAFTVLLTLLLLAGAAAGGYLLLRDTEEQQHRVGLPNREARRYFEAWNRGDYDAMRRLVHLPPREFAAGHESFLDALGATDAEFRPERPRFVGTGRTRARAAFTARLVLHGLGPWRYRGRLDLVRVAPGGADPAGIEGRWRVSWSAATLHPRLRAGLEPATERSWHERAPILGAGGQVLVGASEGVEVGVEPRRIRDRAEVAAALEEHLDFPRAALDAALDAPGVQPDWFVPIVWLPRDRYEALRPVLVPVPGIIFRETDRRYARGDTARALIGRTGEVTAELLEEWGPPYRVGDVVGLSGLERAYEQRLAGTPAGAVHLVRAGTDERVATIHRFRGRAPRPLRTTLDPATQAAAEAALDGAAAPAALVAVDPATGAVRAVANRPVDGWNRAMGGRYPPGSTFKVVTGAALLSSGVTTSTAVACPGEIEAGGRRFHNFEGEALGEIDFRSAFVHSCNTAFIGLSGPLDRGALGEAAAAFGFGARYGAGVDTFGGSFPDPVDDAERAAAAIGQGRVEASPLHMASVAAAVAGGAWRPPFLVRGERAGARPRPLDAGVAATLRDLMAAVVAEGTGTRAAVPGRAVAGKTGTAEFGEGDPAPTHAWFVGFTPGTAFAVLVEGGGVGGRVAAPLAARFVAAL